MSVSRECAYIEVTDRGGWYLFLAREEYGELTPWSADCIGPFTSEKTTNNYLHDNFANPGGYCVDSNLTYARLNQTLRTLLDQATKPRRRW